MIKLLVPRMSSTGGGSEGMTPLSEYCKPKTGIDILVLSFLNSWGVSGDIPSGRFGNIGCSIDQNGIPTAECSNLASQIKGCQSAGKKIIVSLGGAGGSYTLTSQSQAEKIGQYLWDAYGKGGNPAVKRPFGDAVVDGWDFDLEHSSDTDPAGRQWYPDLVNQLRTNSDKDKSRKYYITAAPQCVSPDASLDDAIQNSVFDYLFVQFYNNPKQCSLNIPGNASINWDTWNQRTSSSKSNNAKIFVGAPASDRAAPSGGYVGPSHLATLIKSLKSEPYFGGVMLWDAHWSDLNIIADCTYAQQVKSILTTGKTCPNTPDVPDSVAFPNAPTFSAPASPSFPPATSSAVYPPPASTSPASILPDNSSSHVSSSSGTGGGVAQWGQCGGEGYTGSTQCQSPFKCVYGGQYWSSCQ
ncbi:uncharacterized protein TrAtP1_005725 [Trichoderma atroviride]|uniref:uncharacterized protein n=1 Tax=Hypocrea atroviridis TaxID=63577 RepID=UPI00331FC518|nr:hypothetical protein TrAtP1_005725 [Trichoderma atroviride]